MKLPSLVLFGAAVLSAGAATPPPAATPPVTLAPVRVTGDLWESPLERISASVTVFDQSALASGAVRHFSDLVDQVPNLTWTGGTSRPRYLQIRGLGETSQYEGETPDSSVRLQVDDFDFTALGGVATSFDVRQVEVLRGPQAGAFGANAAGGLVRIVTNAPTPYWTGQAEGTVGGDRLRTGGFALGGPLLAASPRELMVRLAVQRSTADGFRENVTLHRASNARDELNARLRLTWQPSAAWTWEAGVLYADLDNGFDEFALDNNGRRTFSDQPGQDLQRSQAISLRGVHQGTAGVRLTTVTTGARSRSRYSYDDDWTAASYEGFSDLRRRRDLVSEEVRLDSTATRGALGVIDRWTLGAYASRTDETGRYTDTDPSNVRGLKTSYRAGNQALFGQAGHDLDASTRLIVGLRAERVDLSGRGVRTRFRASRGTYDPEVTFQPAFADTLWGGKVTLERDLAPGLIGFASLTRGYKSGGINIDARISPPSDPLTYATERLWNSELGLRGHAFDRRLNGEVTLFLLSRHGTQVRDAAGFGGNYRFFTSNGAGAQVAGFESAATWNFSREWSLQGTWSHLESELDRFRLTNGSTGGGRRLANTPRHGWTLGPRWRAADGWFAQGDWVGRSAQYDSNSQDEQRRAFQLWNASLGWRSRAWSVTLWGRNLGDARYDKRVFFFGNEDPDYIEQRYEDRADPRQFGVTMGYAF